MIRPCDRRTDGRAIAYSALSIYVICCRALKTIRCASLRLLAYYTVIIDIIHPYLITVQTTEMDSFHSPVSAINLL